MFALSQSTAGFLLVKNKPISGEDTFHTLAEINKFVESLSDDFTITYSSSPQYLSCGSRLGYALQVRATNGDLDYFMNLCTSRGTPRVFKTLDALSSFARDKLGVDSFVHYEA